MFLFVADRQLQFFLEFHSFDNCHHFFVPILLRGLLTSSSFGRPCQGRGMMVGTSVNIVLLQCTVMYILDISHESRMPIRMCKLPCQNLPTNAFCWFTWTQSASMHMRKVWLDNCVNHRCMQTVVGSRQVRAIETITWDMHYSHVHTKYLLLFRCARIS